MAKDTWIRWPSHVAQHNSQLGVDNHRLITSSGDIIQDVSSVLVMIIISQFISIPKCSCLSESMALYCSCSPATASREGVPIGTDTLPSTIEDGICVTLLASGIGVDGSV